MLRNNGLKGKIVLIASQRFGKCIPSELTQTFFAEEVVAYFQCTFHQSLGEIYLSHRDHTPRPAGLASASALR